MTKAQQRVEQFMRIMGQETPSSPQIPSYDIRKLRVKLLLEEVLEFAEAVGIQIDLDESEDSRFVKITKQNFLLSDSGKKTDLVEAADALADIDYVNLGAASALGIDLQPVQEEVHDSNMTKLWTEEDLNLNRPKEGTYSVKLAENGDFIVRRNDGKILKPQSYRAPDIAPILKAQDNLSKV